MNNPDWSRLAQTLLNTWLAGLQPTPDLRAELWRFGAPAMGSTEDPGRAEEIPGFRHLADLLREMAEALTRARRSPVDADELLRMALEVLRQQLIPLQAAAREAAAPVLAWLDAQARPTLGPGREAQRRLGQVARAARAHLDATSALAALHMEIVDRALGECGAQLGRTDGMVLDSLTSLHAWLCASLDETYRRSALTDVHIERFAEYFNSGVRLRVAAQQWQADAWDRWGMQPPFVTPAATPEVPIARDSAPAPIATDDMKPSPASTTVADTPGPIRTQRDETARRSSSDRSKGTRKVVQTREIKTMPGAQKSEATASHARTVPRPAPRVAKPAPGSKPVPAAEIAAKGSRRATASQTSKPAVKPEFDISLFAQAGEN